MKNILTTIIFILVLSSPALSQKFNFVAGAEGSYLIPRATLGDRFKPSTGINIYFGKQFTEKLSWIGRFDYFSFKEENREKLNLTRKLTINNAERSFTVPLPKLEMEFKAAGLIVNGKYHLFSSPNLKTNLEFGFGIYYWVFNRNDYYEQILVDTTGNGDMMVLTNLAVPPSQQIDWSGAINFGFEQNVLIINPVWFVFAANYKMILGELWPTLALDLENVSGIQMFDIRAGFRAEF